MINVLFVCLGNICRSPMADGVFQDMVKKAGLTDQISVDSAGTGGWHAGETAHKGTQKILKKHGILYDGRSRKLTHDHLKHFDYVLAMDKSNLSNIKSMVTHDTDTRIMLFLQHANDAGAVSEEEVPDPYYTGGFDHVYDLVSKGSQAFLDHIRAEHNL